MKRCLGRFFGIQIAEVLLLQLPYVRLGFRKARVIQLGKTSFQMNLELAMPVPPQKGHMPEPRHTEHNRESELRWTLLPVP